MNLKWAFEQYVEHLAGAVGHADRRAPLADYCRGLLLPGERKSIEPMAARVAPRQVSATHQSLHHFVAQSAWEDAAVLGAVREYVLPRLTAERPIEAWIVDDTGFPYDAIASMVFSPSRQPVREGMTFFSMIFSSSSWPFMALMTSCRLSFEAVESAWRTA